MSRPVPRLMIITDAAIDDPLAPIERVMEVVSPDDFFVQVRLMGWEGTGGGHAVTRSGTPTDGALWAMSRIHHDPRVGSTGSDAVPPVAQRDRPPRLVFNSGGTTSSHFGVHVKSSEVLDAPWASASQRFCGRSCHTVADVIAASEAGYDYVTLSPIASVAGKGEPLGVDGFARMVRDIRAAGAAVPILALGGVTPELAPALRNAGAHGVAVIRAISRADDPAAVARAFVQAFD